MKQSAKVPHPPRLRMDFVNHKLALQLAGDTALACQKNDDDAPAVDASMDGKNAVQGLTTHEQHMRPVDLERIHAAAFVLWSTDTVVSLSGWPSTATAVSSLQRCLEACRTAECDAALLALTRSGLAVRFIELLACPYDGTPAANDSTEEAQLCLTRSTAVQYAVCKVRFERISGWEDACISCICI